MKVVPGAGEAQWSDSQGMVAFCDPDAVGRSIAFTVTSDGYTLPSGPTVTLAATAGGAARVTLARRYAGERLYRATGQGIYRDSVLLGSSRRRPPRRTSTGLWAMGQDTPSTFVYAAAGTRSAGCTDCAAHFPVQLDTSGATSPLARANFSPDLGRTPRTSSIASGFSRGIVDTAADPSAASAFSGAGSAWTDRQRGRRERGASQVFGTDEAASSPAWSALSPKARSGLGNLRVRRRLPYTGAPIPAGRSIPCAIPLALMLLPTGRTWLRFPATPAGVQDLAGYEVYSAYGAVARPTSRRTPTARWPTPGPRARSSSPRRRSSR